MLHQEHASNRFPLALRDPTALARGIEMLDKISHNASRESLAPLVPAILLGVQDPMPVNDPTHVTRLVAAQRVRCRGCRGCRGCRRLERRTEQFLNGLRGVEQALLLAGAQAVQDSADLSP